MFVFIATLAYDLDPDSMTSALDLHLDVLRMYLVTKNQFVDQGIQKLEPANKTDRHRQTDRQMRPNAKPSSNQQ